MSVLHFLAHLIGGIVLAIIGILLTIMICIVGKVLTDMVLDKLKEE